MGYAETPTEAPEPQARWSGSRIREYRRLGRTEARISDISLGSTKIRAEKGGEEIARRVIELGVNYFDTAPDYAEAGSELLLGRAMKGYRDQMFIATKFCTPQGHLPPSASVREHMEVVEASLKRLQTDHVDLVHIHACNSVERLLAPNTHEAFDRLKEQGKVRFLGFSSHTPRLEEVANAAIESGRIDVMMLAYHYGSWPQLGEIIDRAAENDIGVVAMKTLKGARHRGLLENRDEADSYTQAAFKWVLSNPNVAGLVISFFDPQHVDEYLYASGGRPTSEDLASAREVRPAERRAALLPALRGVPGFVSGGPGHRRRAPVPHVLRGLRRREGGHASLRQARAAGGRLHRLQRSVRRRLPARPADPGAHQRRASPPDPGVSGRSVPATQSARSPEVEERSIAGVSPHTSVHTRKTERLREVLANEFFAKHELRSAELVGPPRT